MLYLSTCYRLIFADWSKRNSIFKWHTERKIKTGAEACTWNCVKWGNDILPTALFMQIIMLCKWMMKIWLIYEVISDPEVFNVCQDYGERLCTLHDLVDTNIDIFCIKSLAPIINEIKLYWILISHFHGARTRPFSIILPSGKRNFEHLILCWAVLCRI